MRNLHVKSSIILFLLSVMMMFSVPSYAERYMCGGTGLNHSQCEKLIKKEQAAKKKGKNFQNILSDANMSAPKHLGEFFSGFVKKIMGAGDRMAKRYIGIAIGMTVILGSIAMVWLGIMIMLSQADIWHMGLRPLFSLIMTVGFAVLFLKLYIPITTAVIDGFLYAAEVLIGGVKGGSVIISIITSFASHFSTMSSEMFDLLATFPAHGGAFGAILWIVNNLFNVVIDLFVGGTVVAAFGIMFILFIIIYLTYQMVAAIAIAVGPVFIPFMVLPVTKSLFDGWVKMLIMSGIYLMTSTVIVGLMLTAASSYFKVDDVMAATGHGQNYSLFVNLWAAIELFVVESVAILALLKTHEFAHAIGGNVNISGMNAANGMVNMAKKLPPEG